MGVGNGERGESPQGGCLLAQAPSCPVMGSEMQQVATAGFEEAQAGTAETHLDKEMCLAAFSQTKLPSPFLAREEAQSGNETPWRAYSKMLLPSMGLARSALG